MAAFKKAYKNTKKAVKRRYGLNKTSKIPKYGVMAGDAKKLAMMVSMLNAEKKFIEQKPVEFSVGQVAQNASGARQWDVSPLMSQGTDASTRNGNSIKLTASLFQFQIKQQSSAITTPITLIVEMWRCMGTPIGAFTSSGGVAPMTDLFDPSVFSNVIDATSIREQNHYGNYKLLRRKVVKLQGDTLAASDIQTKTFIMPHKWNKGKGHHVRYQGTANSSADIASGAIYMTFRADIGNKDATASTLTTIPITAALSGITVNFGYTHWYYDN